MAQFGTAITLTYFAWNTSDLDYETGDVANHTLTLIRDGVAGAPTNNPTEQGGGAYVLDLTAAEMQAATIVLRGVSSTEDVILIPVQLTTIRGLGTGARTVTVTVNDGVDPVEGAVVRLTGPTPVVGTTDADGQVTFNVDDGTYAVAITRPGYQFAGDTLVVTGDATPTYSMTALSITPSDPGLVTGWIVCRDEFGIVEEGVTVTLRAVRPPRNTAIGVDTAVRTAATDAEGLAEFTGLVPGTQMEVRRGDGEAKRFTVPASGPFELPSIAGAD